jgi:hypothetical protein
LNAKEYIGKIRNDIRYRVPAPLALRDAVYNAYLSAPDPGVKIALLASLADMQDGRAEADLSGNGFGKKWKKIWKQIMDIDPDFYCVTKTETLLGEIRG